MLKLEHFVGSGKILARAIGEQQTLNLLEQFGGQCFWISKHPKANHSTSQKLGLQAHRALAAHWPDKEFELPMASHVKKNLRNEAIHNDAQYLSMREMVSKYQMTRSQIQSILRNRCDEMSHDPSDEEKQLKLAGF